MKIEIFDTYNIRARVCPCIILISPIALTLLLCFKNIFSAERFAVLIAIILAFANSIPIRQRIKQKRSKLVLYNYAALYLNISDNTIDKLSKKRYYKILSKYDSVFVTLNKYSNSLEYQQICESAVELIKSKTRETKVLLEENINFGFSKNMLLNKLYGIILCSLNIVFISVYSLFTCSAFINIPIENWITLTLTVLVLLFWLFVINEKFYQEAGKRYAIALIRSIDTLS